MTKLSKNIERLWITHRNCNLFWSHQLKQPSFCRKVCCIPAVWNNPVL